MQGTLHALPLGGTASREVGVDPDEPVVMASVYKLPLLVAFCRQIDAGEIDPREPVTVVPGDRTSGPTGLSVLRDPVTMSWRDLACSMIAVSDNAAADVLLERVGLSTLEATSRTSAFGTPACSEARPRCTAPSSPIPPPRTPPPRSAC